MSCAAGAGSAGLGGRTKNLGMLARQDSTQLQAALPPPREEEFDLKQIFRVLRRRLATIIITVVVITGFAYVIALNMTPQYTTVSTIVVEPRETLIVNLDDTQQNIPQDGSMINTHVKVLTSNTFVQQVIEKLDLLSDPQFNVALTDTSRQNYFGAFVSDRANTLLSEALSWARMPLVAIGLANQSPQTRPDLPVGDEVDGDQQRPPLASLAAGESRDRVAGEGQKAERRGHHTAEKADEQGPARLDGWLTELDRAPAMVRAWLLDQYDGAKLDPAIDDQGEGGVTEPSTAQLDPGDPRIAVVEGNELFIADLGARSAELVPAFRFEVERGGRTGVGSGERDSLGAAPSSREEKSGSSAVAEDGVRDALMAAATEIFLEQLNVGPAGQSYAISVAFTSVNPEIAAQVANTMAELFVENQLESKRIAANGALNWLAGRLNELRAQVVEADKAAEAYREQNELLASGRGLQFDDQELAALTQELIRARAERLATEAKLRRIQELRSSGESLDAVPDIMLSPVIADLRQMEMTLLREEAQLRQEYGPRHPNIIQIEADKDKLNFRIDAEIQHVIGSLANQIATIQVREDTLQAKLEDAKAGSLQNSRAEIQLRLLEREAESTRTLYATFLNRFKELTEVREMLEPGVRVISQAAVPTEPSFPQVKLMTGAGFMGSLMFAVLLAFVVDRLDGGLRTGRQAEAVLNVPSIGLIPKDRGAALGRGPHLYLAKRPTSAYAEAIRGVQTALYFSNVDRPPQVVLVTSSVPGEGKTTLALSLAALLAGSGYRTVAVDLDLRAPTLRRQLRKTEGGDLISYMREHEQLDQILHKVDEVDNLHIIPTRRLTGSPTDLLASQRMAALMAELRARYQYVILDSPPLLGMSDSRFAALLADTVVFVVCWSRTGEEVAEKALAILRDSGTPVAGAVLTQVNVRRQRRYSPADVAHYYGPYKKYYVN